MSWDTDAVEVEEYRDYRIEIHYDEDPMSPREWSNLTRIFAFHNRYTLGDDNDYSTDNYGGWAELGEAIETDLEPLATYSLFMYEHSGIALSVDRVGQFADPWDSGQVGFVVVTKETQAECGTPPELFDECVKGEIETYNEYLSGQVFGYIVYSPEGEDLDSCWGFYGGTDYVLTEARGIVDSYANERGVQMSIMHSIERG